MTCAWQDTEDTSPDFLHGRPVLKDQIDHGRNNYESDRADHLLLRTWLYRYLWFIVEQLTVIPPRMRLVAQSLLA